MIAYNPMDWYWIASDGRVYASGRSSHLNTQDPEFQAWIQAGGIATPWPQDVVGAQSDAALHDVLSPYGLTVAGYAPVPASVSSAQAKIQLLRTLGAEDKKTLLDDVTQAVQTAGGEAAIWFAEARTWERANPYVASLAQSLKLPAAQVDALFVAAAQIQA